MCGWRRLGEEGARSSSGLEIRAPLPDGRIPPPVCVVWLLGGFWVPRRGRIKRPRPRPRPQAKRGARAHRNRFPGALYYAGSHSSPNRGVTTSWASHVSLLGARPRVGGSAAENVFGGAEQQVSVGMGAATLPLSDCFLGLVAFLGLNKSEKF